MNYAELAAKASKLLWQLSRSSYPHTNYEAPSCWEEEGGIPYETMDKSKVLRRLDDVECPVCQAAFELNLELLELEERALKGS